ncbi:hypothetical protein FKW77_010025 [Venturia effusa]|uniref:SET domain-containing protein n=1 Tax=Venturia effusa TaxID=50376 RepID=A0A517L277_9PEZI|nr:hypothetical protein FKW77_010025 [Venturia effusa]
MRAGQILKVSVCAAKVFASEPSSWHPTVSGDHADEFAIGEQDIGEQVLGLAPDSGLHTLKLSLPYNEEVNCMWSTNHTAQYCACTHPEFDHGKGISILTTPARAEILFATSLSTMKDDHTVRDPLFRTVFGLSGVAGHGRGLFATSHISAGSLITQEAPIMLVDHNFFRDVESEDAQLALLLPALEKLPKTTRQTFEELHAGSKLSRDSRVSKTWTNSYSISGGPRKDWPGLDSEDDPGMMAVHANISKINHSCRSNVASQWDWESLSHKTYALRDIAVDEELTMNYFDTRQTSKDRREYVENSLGFKCKCKLCKAENKTIDLSDDRINEIHLLESHLEDLQIAPADPTGMAELLVSLYEQEGLHLYMSKAYALAALEWNGVGNEFQARSWAYKSVGAGLIVGETAGVEDYVEDMQELLDGARTHWSWKHRVR